jgi:hypothetical protein
MRLTLSTVMKSCSVADLIFYTLASYGLCYILMEAKILNFVRDKITKLKFFKELLNCSLCTGFWTGLLIGTFIPYNNILFALYSSATCYLIYLVNYILLNKVYPIEKEQ